MSFGEAPFRKVKRPCAQMMWTPPVDLGMGCDRMRRRLARHPNVSDVSNGPQPKSNSTRLDSSSTRRPPTPTDSDTPVSYASHGRPSDEIENILESYDIDQDETVITVDLISSL
jgi:hypothetical protein